MGAMFTLLLVILHPAVPASKVSFCTFQTSLRCMKEICRENKIKPPDQHQIHTRLEPVGRGDFTSWLWGWFSSFFLTTVIIFPSVSPFTITVTNNLAKVTKALSEEVVWVRSGFGAQQLLSHGVIKLIEDSRSYTIVAMVVWSAKFQSIGNFVFWEDQKKEHA